MSNQKSESLEKAETLAEVVAFLETAGISVRSAAFGENESFPAYDLKIYVDREVFNQKTTSS